MLIQNSAAFYNPKDEFKVVLTISGAGAYWGAGAASMVAYPVGVATTCEKDGPGTGSVAVVTAPYTITTESGATAGVVASGAGCGTIAATAQYKVLTSSKFTGIDTANVLEVDMPSVVFDASKFKNGDAVNATVELYRLPCGKVFTATRKIAEFVTTCPAAAPISKLLFPYAVPMDSAKSSGWWYGMSFCNASTVAGSYTIYVYEADGDSFKSVSTTDLAAGKMVTFGGADLLKLTWTTLTGGTTAVMGDTTAFIKVECNFGSAGGFGMMGNGSDSTGYVAYGDNTTGVNVSPKFSY
jgi:hypothetical protein